MGGRAVTAGQPATHNEALLWDAENGTIIASLKLDRAPIRGVRFSPDGQLVAIIAGREVSVWSAVDGSPHATLTGHEAEVLAVSFSPDCRRLLTGSEDRSAVLWDLAAGKLETVYLGHPGPVRFAAYSPDGQRVATGSTDGVVRVWPLEILSEVRRRCPRELTATERDRYDLLHEE